MFRIISSKQQTWILCCELDLLLHLSLLTAALINRGGSHPRLTRKIKAQLFYLTNTRPAPTQSFSERPYQFLCVRRLWPGICPSSCVTHWELWRSDARRTALWCSLQGLCMSECDWEVWSHMDITFLQLASTNICYSSSCHLTHANTRVRSF